MAGINKVILIGNLGADPETRITPGGVAVANIRLAVSETWKDHEGQRQEKTEWINVVAFRQLAELIGQYLRKGAKIYVEGKIQTRSWDDKQTGTKRYATEVVAETLQFLDRRPAENQPGEGRPARHRPPEAGRTEVADDLPF